MLPSSRVGILAVAFLIGLAAQAGAQFGMPLNHSDPKLEPAAVRELVAQYCRLDYAGARLSPADWSKLEPLVAWHANPDFLLFMTTSRFDVDNDPVPGHGKYEVTVHYRLLGRYDLSEGYSLESANQIEDVRFTVTEVNGEWRISEAEPGYPHPSRAAALQWASQKLAETQDPATKVIYQRAIEQLQTQKSNPLAK
jgi:hypothetical protein